MTEYMLMPELTYKEKPTITGTYLCYVNPPVDIPYASLQLLLFINKQWVYPGSAEKYRNPVYGCYGPIPSLKFDESEPCTTHHPKLPTSYCNIPAVLRTGQYMYPHRKDLWERKFWECHKCKARVGCHKGTDTPLGTLADVVLRDARQLAHSEFDSIWKEAKYTKIGFTEFPLIERSACYWLLSLHLKIPINTCHIAQLNAIQCGETILFSRELKRKLSKEQVGLYEISKRYSDTCGNTNSFHIGYAYGYPTMIKASLRDGPGFIHVDLNPVDASPIHEIKKSFEEHKWQ